MPASFAISCILAPSKPFLIKIFLAASKIFTSVFDNECVNKLSI